jgi:hypothetical protein
MSSLFVHLYSSSIHNDRGAAMTQLSERPEKSHNETDGCESFRQFRTRCDDASDHAADKAYTGRVMPTPRDGGLADGTKLLEDVDALYITEFIIAELRRHGA